jgi:hypothetical protein
MGGFQLREYREALYFYAASSDAAEYTLKKGDALRSRIF